MEMTKPTAPMIPPNVGVTMMCSLGALVGHWQWYGPMLLTLMISGKHDVSCETESKKIGWQKYPIHMVHFYVS